MKFWRLRDSTGEVLYIDPTEIAVVYISERNETAGAEAGRVRVLLKSTGSYFSLDDGSGLQVLEYFERTSVPPGADCTI